MNSSRIFDDVWVLNTVSLEWCCPSTYGERPPKRISFSSNLIFGDQLVIFGGSDELNTTNTLFNDAYALNLTTMKWSKLCVQGTLPAPRTGHTSTVVDNKMIVFGGYGINLSKSQRKYYDDIYVLDCNTFTWNKLETSGVKPVPRHNHTTTAVGPELVVYGGRAGDKIFEDIHVLDVDKLEWRVPTISGKVPHGRELHCAAFIGTEILVHGGSCAWPGMLRDFSVLCLDGVAKVLEQEESVISENAEDRKAEEDEETDESLTYEQADSPSFRIQNSCCNPQFPLTS